MAIRTTIAGGLIALLFGAILSTGCIPARKVSYQVDEMRALIKARVPGIQPQEIVVPWEVHPEDVRRARRAIILQPSQTEQAHALLDALSSPLSFNLTYAPSATAPATTTLQTGKGNCFSLASVYVGLARELGLPAYYLDFSSRIRELRDDGEILVNAGHVTGVISIGHFRLALDVSNRQTFYAAYRFMDDVEAVAHYYNNRGYDLIYQALHKGDKIPWRQAKRLFWIATRIRPDFVRAWNNLGVACARLDQKTLARESYREALRINPEFASAYTNLGLLALAERDLPAAVRLFELSIEYDSENPYPRYLLGLARYRHGQIDLALKALEETLDLNKQHTRARQLLARIYTRLGRMAAADRVMPAPAVSNADAGGKRSVLKPFVRWPLSP